MGVNTSGLKRGNGYKEAERLYVDSDMQSPIISEQEAKKLLKEMIHEGFLRGMMMPSKDYAIF